MRKRRNDNTSRTTSHSKSKVGRRALRRQCENVADARNKLAVRRLRGTLRVTVFYLTERGTRTSILLEFPKRSGRVAGNRREQS